jgi:hypothetical protein
MTENIEESSDDSLFQSFVQSKRKKIDYRLVETRENNIDPPGFDKFMNQEESIILDELKMPVLPQNEKYNNKEKNSEQRHD